MKGTVSVLQDEKKAAKEIQNILCVWGVRKSGGKRWG